MSELLCSLSMVYVYVDDTIVLGAGTFEKHIKYVEKVLLKLDEM